jgi:DNA-directed RNA polymerase subunit RPC12/RpoP
MGMFDTLKIKCPCCGHINYEQNKMGPQELKEYDESNVPVQMIFDMSQKEYRCVECGEKYKIDFEYRFKVRCVGDEMSRWKRSSP